MDTLKMVWRTALFLGAVTVVFVLYTVGVALVERHFSPKYAKKQEQTAPVAEAVAPKADNRVGALLDSGQARCELPLGMQDAGLEDRDVIVGIRAEQIVLAPAEANGLPVIRAEVQVVEPTGPDTLVFVQLNDTKVCCRLAPDVAPQVGETLTLQFDPAKVLLFDAKTGERLGTVASLPAQGHADNVTQFKGR